MTIPHGDPDALTIIDESKQQKLLQSGANVRPSPLLVYPFVTDTKSMLPEDRDYALFAMVIGNIKLQFRKRMFESLLRSAKFKRDARTSVEQLRGELFAELDLLLDTVPFPILQRVAYWTRHFLAQIFDEYASNPLSSRESVKRALDDFLEEVDPDAVFDPKSVELIGSGGFGQVYSAQLRLTGERVALKMMREQNESSFHRMQQEAFNLMEVRQLDRLLTAYFVFRAQSDVAGIKGSKGHIVIVSECLEGQTLQQQLEELDITPNCALSFSLGTIVKLLDAVNQMHSRGLFHRDIKPANIQVLPDGSYVILDLGLSTKRGAPVERPRHSTTVVDEDGLAYTGRHKRKTIVDQRSTCDTKTLTKGVLGTPLYLSPENFPDANFSSSSDAWPCQLIALEVLAGRPLFSHLSKQQVLNFIQDVAQGRATMTDYLSCHFPDIISALPPILLALFQEGFLADPQERLHPQESVWQYRVIELLVADDDTTRMQMISRACDSLTAQDYETRPARRDITELMAHHLSIVEDAVFNCRESLLQKKECSSIATIARSLKMVALLSRT